MKKPFILHLTFISKASKERTSSSQPHDNLWQLTEGIYMSIKVCHVVQICIKSNSISISTVVFTCRVVIKTKHLRYVQLKFHWMPCFFLFYNKHILVVHVSCVADIDIWITILSCCTYITHFSCCKRILSSEWEGEQNVTLKVLKIIRLWGDFNTDQPQDWIFCLHCSVDVQLGMLTQMSGLYLNVPVLTAYWSRYSTWLFIIEGSVLIC